MKEIDLLNLIEKQQNGCWIDKAMEKIKSMRLVRHFWINAGNAKPEKGQRIIRKCKTVDCVNPDHLCLSDDLELRFWSKVDKSNDCWNWTRSNSNGYGCFYFGHKRYIASRLAYEITYGKIPDGIDVCHKCDNKACVRPDHLFLGTAKDNMQDCINKGRWGSRQGEKNSQAKLTPIKVVNLRKDYACRQFSIKELSGKYSITKSTIYRIIKGNYKGWSHIPFTHLGGTSEIPSNQNEGGY